MSRPLAEAVSAALTSVIDPELRRPITELDMVGDVEVDAAPAETRLVGDHHRRHRERAAVGGGTKRARR